MEKRVILAFALSIVVMYVFSVLYRPVAPPVGLATPDVQTATNTSAVEQPPPSGRIDTPSTEKESAKTSTPPETLVAEKEEDFVISTPLYTATVSNVGGVLRSYKLNAFFDGEG